jgi:hypothetical protein
VLALMPTTRTDVEFVAEQTVLGTG